MAGNTHNLESTNFGFGRLSLRLHRESSTKNFPMDGNATPTHPDAAAKNRFPDGLQFSDSFRMRSRTASTRSSVSSTHVPDSATTYSMSTLNSPISTSYASDIQESLVAHTIDDEVAAHRKSFHAHKPSNATCSTFVNEEGDVPVLDEYPDCPKVDAAKYIKAENEVETQSASPISEHIVKEEGELTPGASGLRSHPSSASGFGDYTWESSSSVSEEVCPEDIDNVLDYTLQLVYGTGLDDTSAPSAALRQLVFKCIRDIGQHIWHAPSAAPPNQNMWGASSTSTPSQGGGGGSGGGGGGDGGGGGSMFNGKRKKQAGGQDEGEDLTDGEGSGFWSTKRAKPNPKGDENLHLSCPYRKRNPRRFNVREHHSCAMTYFPKFAELRQHIVKQHKRDDPSAFVCDRCHHNFTNRKDLRDHQRQPKEKMCDTLDNDPEAGIDAQTSTKLLSRKRASGSSAEVQWREIWGILFPDDDESRIEAYHFTPVIEHSEFLEKCLADFQTLTSSLRDMIKNTNTLDTIATKYHQSLVETAAGVEAKARAMPYVNRSNKRGGDVVSAGSSSVATRPSSTSTPNLFSQQRRSLKAMPSRPDSGVVVDDGSEDGGSVIGLAHKNSVRTVRGRGGRRGSNLALSQSRESTQPPQVTNGLFGGPLRDEFSSAAPPLHTIYHETPVMNPADVQDWSHRVLHSQQYENNLFAPDHLPTLGQEHMASQPEFPPWQEQLYSGEMPPGLEANFGDMDQSFHVFPQGQ